MGYSKQWEAFLFQCLHIVAARPMQKIQLFDLLVKRASGSWPGGRTVRLANLGSILHYRLNLGDDSNSEEFKELDNEFVTYEWQIREDLEALQHNRDLADLESEDKLKVLTIEMKYQDIREQIATDSGLGASILQWCTGRCGTSNLVEFTIVNPSHLAIQEDAFHELFIGDEGAKVQPLWKPDIQKINRARSPAAAQEHGDLEMWVVTEKLFCEELETGGSHSASAEVSVSVDGSCNTGVQAGRSAQESRQIRGPYLLGFKAIRLFYDSSSGALVRWRPDMGRKVPTVRFGGDGGQGLNESVYHMGGLFEPPPGSDSGDGLDWSNGSLQLECLQVETADEDNLVAPIPH